jgi:hypothetical protein
MSKTAMRRLHAADPVPHPPAPRPIDTVIPGWESVSRVRSDRRSDAEPLDLGRRARRRSTSGSRVSSGLAAGLGVGVTIAVVVFALIAVHATTPPARTTGTPASMHGYTDAQGWSLTYPSALHVVQGLPPSALARQVTLTSFAAPRKLAGRSPTGKRLAVTSQPYVLPLDAAGRFPADGAALILQPFRGFALGPDSAFPLVLDEFGRPQAEPFFSSADDRSAAIPPGRTHIVVGYSQEITVTVLIGAKVSPALRSDLANTVASLAFRRLAPGSLVDGAEILGPASAYPVGSFTLFHARFGGNSSGPIYLVHAPGRLGFGHQCLNNSPCTPAGSFYGIGPNYNTRLDHAPVCQLRLDRPLDEFYCANMGVRWDRVGRVIARPASESYAGSSEGLYAKVTWDGQVMITPGWGPQLSRPAVHQLWPTWHQPNEPLSR